MLKTRLMFAIAAIALGTTIAFAVTSPDFQRVLANPAAFHGKRVTLVGVAEVTNNEFWIYPDAFSAKKGDFTKAVFVMRDPKGPLYKELNKHWLKISGTVDAKARLPLGYGPCAISLDQVELLRSR